MVLRRNREGITVVNGQVLYSEWKLAKKSKWEREGQLRLESLVEIFLLGGW